MDLNLAGRVVVIGAGSRGIGKAAAVSTAREGASIVVAARGRQHLDAAVAELRTLGADVLGVTADLTAPGGPERLVEQALGRFGRIDVLVNNTGGGVRGTLSRDDMSMFDAGFARNFWPAVRSTKAALEPLTASGGVVINVLSIWGREAGGNPAYNVSKAALQSFTKAAALELASRRVRVVGVAPGCIFHEGGSWWRRQQEDPAGTAEFVRREIPWGRFGTPTEVGDVIAFLASERASWVTGSVVVVDGGQSRAF
jgi:3-oxoacyl-[acyl-carrier protein] reductase